MRGPKFCSGQPIGGPISSGLTRLVASVTNRLAPIPGAYSPEVTAWLADPANAAAIAGLTPEDASAKAVEMLTPFWQSFSLVKFNFLGIVDVNVGSTLFIGAILMLIGRKKRPLIGYGRD